MSIIVAPKGTVELTEAMVENKDVLYVDNSTLSSMDCSTHALLQYGFHYTSREESWAATAGKHADEALTLWFKGFSKDHCVGRFTEIYEPFCAEQSIPHDDRLHYDNLVKIVGHWIDTHPREQFPIKIEHPDDTQIYFSYPLTDEGDIVFFGLLDLFGSDRERTTDYYVMDHKTTWSISEYWVEKFRTDSQMKGYTWLAKKKYGEKNVIGVYINALEFKVVPNSERKCKDHGMFYKECGINHVRSQVLGPITFTEEQLVEWRKTAISLAKKYRELLKTYPKLDHLHRVRMQGMFFGSCRFCELKNFCVVGRPLGFIDSMLVKQPWTPWLDERAKR